MSKKMSFKRVNIGCGKSPTKDWINFDNSPSIELANQPYKKFLLKRFGFLNKTQIENIEWNMKNKILYADASKRIPLGNEEVDCIYSSHMMEHLSRKAANNFLNECLRVLKPNGVLRLVLPDFGFLVEEYLNNKDADLFIEKSHLVPPSLDSFRDKLKLILIGYRHHQWLYDYKSLSKVIFEVGFKEVIEQKPGGTCIKNYGELDLKERAHGSLFVEAIK